jgi:hypothetical protein
MPFALRWEVVTFVYNKTSKYSGRFKPILADSSRLKALWGNYTELIFAKSG